MQGKEREDDVIVDTYLEYLAEVRHLSEHTVISYRKDLEDYLRFLGERKVLLRAVTQSDARRYVAYLMRDRHFNPVTVNRKLSCLRRFHHHVLVRGMCAVNPFERIEGTTRYRRLPEVIDRETIIRLLSVEITDFTSLRDSMMFHLFYSTGCRLSELLDADVGDLETSGERLLVRGKGNRQRYVFINPPTMRLLGRYLAQRRDELAGLGKESRALLIGSRGNRLSASSVHSIFEKYHKLLGIAGRFTPHMMRHSFATHMLDNDSGIRIVQELLGHASISTTQIYTHVTQRRLRSVYEKSHPHGRKEAWKSEEQP